MGFCCWSSSGLDRVRGRHQSFISLAKRISLRRRRRLKPALLIRYKTIRPERVTGAGWNADPVEGSTGCGSARDREAALSSPTGSRRCRATISCIGRKLSLSGCELDSDLLVVYASPNYHDILDYHPA